MSRTVVTIPDAAEELRKWLLDGRADVDAVRVVSADVAWDEDADGEPILRFLVTLADPTEETWPTAGILEFHRLVGERAAAAGLDAPWYVGLEAETQDEFDPADAPG